MAVMMNEVGEDEKVEFVVEEVEVTDSEEEEEEEDEDEEDEEEEEEDDDDIEDVSLLKLKQKIFFDCSEISTRRWKKKKVMKIRRAMKWRQGWTSITIDCVTMTTRSTH